MFNRAVALFVVVLALLVASRAQAASLEVRVLDKTGAAFPNVLVIVKSLEDKGEMFRALSNASGSVAERELTPGLYRVIATCPYGICVTKVQEFLVGEMPVHLILKVDVLPTQGNVVQIGPSNSLAVEVVDSEGKPVSFAHVLLRDSDAQNERWYKTDADGLTTVELPEGPITFVVLSKGGLKAETFSALMVHDMQAKGRKLIVRLK